MEWDNILKDAVKDGKIKELYLQKIPVLKNCDNWKKVEPVGWIDHQMKFSYYRGGLVRLSGKLFFVTNRTIDALSEFWELKFPQKIEVIEE